MTCWAYLAPVPVFPSETVQQYNASVLPQQIEAFMGGQLAPYLKQPKVLMCPADKVDATFLMRNIQFTSYIWNGSVNKCQPGTPSAKITALRPEYILQWEEDETTPFFFNDAVNYPDEGISGRHGKGNRGHGADWRQHAAGAGEGLVPALAGRHRQCARRQCHAAVQSLMVAILKRRKPLISVAQGESFRHA